MEVEIKKTISRCIECPHHKVVDDPDPDDWFNDDDQAMICLHPDCKVARPDMQLNYYKSRGLIKGVVVESCCRPYEIPKINIPVYCPLLKNKQ